MNLRRAVILAGGKGSRLRPYTAVLPKPLMPIGNYSILEVIVRQLKKYHFDHITLAVNHQAEIIKAVIGDGSKWGLKIDYSLEDRPLSTIAPLKLIHDLPENFLVMNGDILTDLNFSELYENHVKQKKLFTLSSHRREQLIDYGVLETNAAEELTNFVEKPRHNYLVSMGIYVLNKAAIDHVAGDKPYGFDTLMLDLLKQKRSVQTVTHQGFWLDIGRPDDYMQAIEEYEKRDDYFSKFI